MLIPDKDYRKNISNYSTFIWLLTFRDLYLFRYKNI